MGGLGTIKLIVIENLGVQRMSLVELHSKDAFPAQWLLSDLGSRPFRSA